MMHAKLVSFTDRGAETLARIAALLGDMRVERYARTVDPSLAGTFLSRFAQQAMCDSDLVVFVGAAGIAVRAVAPCLAGKAFDPAVLVVDEAGKFVIPLLSGHLGGANELARRLADGLGATAVITTATDGRNVFAVDSWAKAHGCAVLDPENIKYVSGALLRGETAGLRSAFPVDGRLPAQVSLDAAAESGIFIGFDRTAAPFAHTLHLAPRVVHLGVGCRRGAARETIERAVQGALQTAGVPPEAICAAASVDLKRDEAGLLLFCGARGLPLGFYAADELQKAAGDFAASDFVRETVGADNVCERAAFLSSGGGQRLLGKTARDGVTVALYAENWRARFD
ncbi:MAG: cobalamin biosynthesis protein [Eubacteriales bacterium]|nr:cobalamin biosynthesis protein [Eubacteriales bacterium]